MTPSQGLLFHHVDRRRLPQLRQACCAAAIALGLARAGVYADGETPPISAPVKVATNRTASPPQSPTTGAARPRPEPSTAAAKLPQYQWDHEGLAPAKSKPTDASVRLLLMLPTEPALIEADIQIDGEPFRQARHKRVQAILDSLTQPAAEKNDPATSAQELSEADQRVVAEAVEAASKDAQPTPPKHAAEKEVDAEADPKPAQPPYARPANAAEHVQRYVQATGAPPSAEEIHWLLALWVDGPILLKLKDHFQHFRAHQRPVFTLLDRDRDNVLSPDEIAAAVEAIKECDLNRNDVVEYTEIAEVAAGIEHSQREIPAPKTLLYLLAESSSTPIRLRSDAINEASTQENKPARFDENGDGVLDAQEQQRLLQAEPDLRLKLEFHSADAGKSRLTLLSIKKDLGPTKASPGGDGQSIDVWIGDILVTLSAVQDQPSDQLAIGAVVDGYPLLPALDPNEDGKLTVRELRQVVERLRSFDRDQDGRVAASEARSPVRVCLGLGPMVHRELADLRTVHSKSSAPADAGPSWFVRMDRNQDNDLTRGEFPGTDEQFRALDADGDRLISAQEARDFDDATRKPSEEPQPQSSTPPIEENNS